MILLTVEEILAGESKNVEFKVQRPKDNTKYMKTVVAFANGDGGRIVFGVDDKTREVVGIPNDIVFSEIDAITSAISDSCEPVVIPDVYLQTIEGKTIVIAEISAGKQRPYYIKSLGIKDGTYIRIAGTSRPASGSEHLISHALDDVSRYPKMHGLQVGVASYLCALLQENPETESLKEVLLRTGFFEFVSHNPFDKEEFISALRMAPTVKKDYYTILSEPGMFQRAVELLDSDEILRLVVKKNLVR